jgi:hypothetical protein
MAISTYMQSLLNVVINGDRATEIHRAWQALKDEGIDNPEFGYVLDHIKARTKVAEVKKEASTMLEGFKTMVAA